MRNVMLPTLTFYCLFFRSLSLCVGIEFQTFKSLRLYLQKGFLTCKIGIKIIHENAFRATIIFGRSTSL